MIDIVDDVVAVCKAVEALDGHVYRRWPKVAKKTPMPACLISRMGASPVFTDADGSEVVVRLTYSIDINAESQEQADGIAEQVADGLARYNLHRTGFTDFYDDALRVYRVILTVTGTVDRRGNTFS